MQAPDFFVRRRLLLGTAAACGAPAAALAQDSKAAAGSRSLTVAQIVDTSARQQDVSKDFLIGSRAAWQDINSRGGLRGRPVTHLSVEVDGSAESLRSALVSLRDNPSCIVLSGSAGDPVASQITASLRSQNFQVAHVAPWLQNASLEVDDRTFPIFAARQEQIGHALKSLSVMGVDALGVIYASTQERTRYQGELERIAQQMKLRLQNYNGEGEGELNRLGLRLNNTSPAVMLFLGGTPELVQFTQGLAGFIAARYTHEVLQDIDGNLTRQSALAAFQRRASLDLGGYRVSYDQNRRSATYVTQSMLTADGRVLG